MALHHGVGALGLVTLLVWPIGIASANSDSASFTYRNGFTALGDFSGACVLNGFAFTPGAPAALEASSTNWTITLHHTYVNQTFLLPEGPLNVYNETRNQTRDVTRGTEPLRIEWRGNDGFGPWLSHWPGNLTLEVTGQAWETGVAQSGLGAGPDALYEPSSTAALSRFAPSVPGPGRVLWTDQLAGVVAGDAILRVTDGQIRGDDITIELPPYRQVLAEQESPVLGTRSLLLTHARVDLPNSTITFDPVGQAFCSDLQWSGTGNVTYRNAVGEATARDLRVPFDRREFTLSGALFANETVLIPNRYSAPVVAAETRGSFDSVGIDFSTVVEPLSTLDYHLEAVVAGSLLLAAIGAFFYAKLSPGRALRHPIRQLIVETVRRNPGVILRELVEASERRYSSIKHHTRILSLLGHVRLVRHGRTVQVFPAGAPADPVAAALARDVPVQFLRGLAATAPITLRSAIRQVRHQFGYSRPGAWKVVRRAEHAGVVKRTTVQMEECLECTNP